MWKLHICAMVLILSLFIATESVFQLWKSARFPDWMPVLGPLCGIHMSLAWDGGWIINGLVLTLYVLAFFFVMASRSKFAYVCYWLLWLGYGAIWAVGYA